MSDNNRQSLSAFTYSLLNLSWLGKTARFGQTRVTNLDKEQLGFALKRAPVDGLKDDAAKKRARVWLNQFAIVHARFLARCVLNWAAACVDTVNASCAAPPS
jgi:hypothetical protein